MKKLFALLLSALLLVTVFAPAAFAADRTSFIMGIAPE